MHFRSPSYFCPIWTSAVPGRNSSFKLVFCAATNVTCTATCTAGSAQHSLLYNLGQCLFQSPRLQTTEPGPRSFQLKMNLLKRYQLSNWIHREAGESGSENKEAPKETGWPEPQAKAYLRDSLVGVLLTLWDSGCIARRRSKMCLASLRHFLSDSEPWTSAIPVTGLDHVFKPDC